MNIKVLVLLATLAMPCVGMACISDTDCAVGSKCLKNPGALYGICSGGTNPGNDNDRQPGFDPFDPTRSIGKTCSFDKDCGPGIKCRKDTGQTKGVCAK